MRFAALSIMTLSLATGSLATGTCSPGANYCGWYLTNSLGMLWPAHKLTDSLQRLYTMSDTKTTTGWSTAEIHQNTVYHCVSDTVVGSPQTCGNGCLGPTAHCG